MDVKKSYVTYLHSYGVMGLDTAQVVGDNIVNTNKSDIEGSFAVALAVYDYQQQRQPKTFNDFKEALENAAREGNDA